MTEQTDLPAEHRRRRRAAHERAAAAHERAAAVDEAAAQFFDEHDKPDLAAKHRAKAEIDRAEALRERQTAAQQ